MSKVRRSRDKMRFQPEVLINVLVALLLPFSSGDEEEGFKTVEAVKIPDS